MAHDETAERGRTADSVEQIEAADTTNPITDPDARLTDPGAGFEPATDEPDVAEEEGPAAQQQQMPR